MSSIQSKTLPYVESQVYWSVPNSVCTVHLFLGCPVFSHRLQARFESVLHGACGHCFSGKQRGSHGCRLAPCCRLWLLSTARRLSVLRVNEDTVGIYVYRAVSISARGR